MATREIEPRRDWFAAPEWWPDWFSRFFERGLPVTRDLFAEHDLRIEERVEDDELVVRAEMPGIDPDKDVDIHVRNHHLELRAQRREETHETEEGRRRSEFRYGSFVRVVPLPPDANESDVRATYKDGILEVRMPLEAGRAKATRIEVERG